MTLHILFFLLVALALLGDARIFLFILNRVVFGDHRHEKSPWTFLIWTVPPILLALTLLWWPVGRWIQWLASRRIVSRITPQRIEDVIGSPFLAQVGAVWLVLAAGVGIFWIVDRIRVNHLGETRVRGTKTFPSEVVKIRKAHVPFAWLRNLGAHNDVYDIEITKHEVFIDDLPKPFDGYRIVFLTDTHVAGFVRRDFYREVVAQTNRLAPDLILLGGDFVTFHRDIPLLGEQLLDGLQSRDGKYAVLGNHDYWAGGAEVRTTMEAHDVHFIINQSAVIERDGAKLPLIGIDEIYRGEPDVEAAFSGVSPQGPCLGLTHHPDMVEELEGRRVDLLLCGHTHGGQIRVPFFGSLVVPSKHEDRYAQGFHRVSGALMYVSRGIGAIPPVRILCKPEIALFTLRRDIRR
jgi:uncharacterized protein